MADPGADQVSSSGYWRQRYAEDTTGWDLGGPCPVFEEFADGPRAPSPGSRVAFPGCGNAYDVYSWRARGHDAVGFDFARDLPHVEHVDVFELGRVYPAHFDAIVEYTCYCAIDPTRRAEYVEALAAALRPGGLVVALLFPFGERDGGPPFPVREEEIDSVWGAAFRIESVETPASSVEPRLGRERLVLATTR